MLITIRDLNQTGRAGNQLFVYAFARGYAEKMGFELQIPFDWWGRKIFANVNEPGISNFNLKQTKQKNLPLDFWFGQGDMDVNDYAQHQLHVDFYSRAKAREWFKLKPEFERFAPVYNAPYSAAHFRRGDYLTTYKHLYCTVSDASYDRAVVKFDIPTPVAIVQEGLRKPPTELEAHGVPWLADFLLLRDAAHLLRANSSFSVWSSWLGHGKTYAPVVGTKVGLQDCEFVEGSWPCTAGVFSNQSDIFIKEK